MPEVEVRIAGRLHRLACAKGEEPHLQRLAAEVDAEAAAIAARLGAVGENRLLAMTAIMLADRLHEARTAVEAQSAQSEPAITEALDRLERVVEAAERD